MQVSSAILGNVDVAPRQYTQQDDQQFAQAGKALRDNRLDLFTAEGAKRNLDGIDEFFQRNRHLPVTVQNIFRAVEERKSEFSWLTPAQHAWYSAAEQNPDLANQIATYLGATSGQPGRLVKDGDGLFENLLLLYNELSSRRESVSAQTIAAAENRIAHRPGKQLHRVPQPRRTTPMSEAAKNDDGSPFLGSDMVRTPDGGWRSKTAGEQAADRRAAEPVKESVSTIRGREQSAAQQDAEGLQGNSHSETSQLAKLFVYDQTNQQIDWIKTRDARRQMQKHFENRRAGSFRQI